MLLSLGNDSEKVLLNGVFFFSFSLFSSVTNCLGGRGFFVDAPFMCNQCFFTLFNADIFEIGTLLYC